MDSTPPLVPLYGVDFRSMVNQAFSSPEPLDAVPSPGGTINQRVRHHLSRMVSDSAAGRDTKPLIFHDPVRKAGARWKQGDGRQVRNVAAQAYYPVWMGQLPIASGAFLYSADASTGLPDDERLQIDERLAEAYWNTYEGLLLPSAVLTAISRAAVEPGGQAFLSALESMRQDMLRKEIDLGKTSELRIAHRVDLLCGTTGASMTDRQLATAEAFVDLLLLQRATMQDIMNAESARDAGQPRSRLMAAVEKRGALVFERVLPQVLQTTRILQEIPEKLLGEVQRRALIRTAFHRTGVFSGQEPASEPAPAPRASSPTPPNATTPVNTPSLEPLSPVSPTPPAPPTDGRPVGFTNEPLEWRDSDPSFDIPEWRALGCENMRPDQMSRHFLILGETGSGKTKSAIFPAVTAALRYPTGAEGEPTSNLAPSMLVIDPKREIAPHLEHLNQELGLGRTIIRLDSTGEHELIVHFFEGLHPLQLTPEEISKRMLSISEAYATSKTYLRDAFWTLQAEGIITQLVAVDLDLYCRGGIEFLQRFWTRVSERITAAGFDLGNEPLAYNRVNYVAVHSHLFNLAALSEKECHTILGAYVDAAREFGISGAKTRQIAAMSSMASETFTSVVATLNNILSETGSESLAQHVSLNPFEGPPEERCLSVMEVMNEGHCVCYYPRDTSSVATSVGKALKAKFFEFTFKRQEQERPFFYVCDEFQRFITSDPMSGEQSFLDRCRAFRGVCILATQSIASLRFALARDGSTAMDESSLEILMNNTGNKLFFRNTDLDTQKRLTLLIPSPYVQGRPHLTQVRPVSTLEVGESYYLLSTGAWGRRRVRLGSTPEQPVEDR